MTDDLERRLSSSMRRAAGDGYDPEAAAASFGERRAARVRSRRTAGAIGLGVVVALAAVAPSLGRSMFGDDRPEVGLSDGATLSEEPPSEAPSAEVVTPLPSPSPEASETPSPPPSAEVHEATPPPPVATEPAPTTAPPSPPPSPSPRRHYFNVDHNYNGRTVTLAVGEELMFLFGRYYGPEYTPLVVSDPEVLTTDGEPRHTPDTQRGGDGDHGYLYVAVKPGEVTVSSRVDDSCSYESPPCESPTSEWYVNVIVTG